METNESESTKSSTKRPAITLTGSGHLSLAIWKNKKDAGFDQYSIRLDKSYKDTDGTYKTTAYVNDQDLLRIAELYRQADEWIERDKQRQRGPSTALRG